MYLAHWGIHNPLQAEKEDYDALAHIEDHRLRVYAAMIRALDRDPTEQNNLAPALSGRVEVMQALLDDHNATQAEPAWPSALELPQLVDKTGAEDYADGDEYVYWPN